MAFIKEESEDVKTEEAFRVKHEDTEDQTKMAFIKEESEDFRIEEVFSLKDTEEQTGQFHSQSWTHSFDPYSDVHLYRHYIFVFICVS